MRVLIVDDEPLTRAALAQLIAHRSDVEHFATADDAQQALAILGTRKFDLLLLDIRMPEMSGLQLVERLSRGTAPLPAIVFITAHQEHAVQAFEKRAVDYVLKPFHPERVHEALNAAVRRTEQERALRMLDVLHSLRANFPDKIRMGVKDKGRVVFVDAREMVSAEAHGNYVLLRSTAGTHLLRETLAAVATLLAPYGFLRIHRSVLINTAFVEAIEPGPGGEWVVRTRTGSEYHVTRTYRRNLRGLAKCWLGTDEFASN